MLALVLAAALTSTVVHGTAVSREPDGPEAPEALAWSVSTRGLSASVNVNDRTHRLAIRTRAIGRSGSLAEAQPGELEVRGEVQLLPRSGATEWFRSHEHGVEHGWTLDARPDGIASQPVWILVETEGDLTPRILEGGLAVWFVDHEAQLRMRYDGLRAWDANGAPVDARLATSPNGFGVRIDDAGARYPITVDPVLGTAPLILTGSGATSYGANVSTAGDVNGDGYSDVLIRDPGFSGPEVSEGRVLLHLGSASGLIATPAWQVEGDFPQGAFGAGMGPAGDVNGDGFDDVILGHPLLANPPSAPGCAGECGEVRLYLGSSTGLALLPSWRWSPGQAGANFGYSCATAGDVNADGLDDVVIGARYYDSPGFTDDGAAFVFFGTLSGDLGTSPAWQRFGGDSGAHFGSSVTTAGDADADGFADIAVGAPNDSPTDQGRVWFYRGTSTGPLTAGIQLCPVPPGTSWAYGRSVACAGDLNGDGFADLIVGADAGDVGSTDVGHVYVHLGRSFGSGTIDPVPADEQWGGQTNGALGYSVAPAGDVNGDGYADVIYGEPAFLTGAPGNAYLLLGQANVPLTRDLLVTGANGDALGQCVSTAGDVNGDGFGDVLIGSPRFNSLQGRVHLFYGQPKPDSTLNDRTYVASSPSSGMGSALALGDVEGDAYADLVVGEPTFTNTLAGQGLVRVFRGGVSGLATTHAWSFEGTSAGMNLGCSIAFLNDVDGDGFGDVLVGAKGASNVEPDEGHVLLFRGSSSGWSTPPHVFESNEAFARMGSSVGAAGDVDGDGLADAVVGAPGTHLGVPGAGALYLFRGRASPPGLVLATGFPISPLIASSQFGAAVAGAGDMNADGRSDVAVGAPGFTSGQPGEGAVYVYRGAPMGLVLAPDAILEGNSVSAEFGRAVATAGDVNGDSFADLLVGAPGWEAATKGGFAFVYRGQSGTSIVNATSTLHAIHFQQPGARTGEALAYAGDLNGDGHPDVLVGVPRWDSGGIDGGRVAVFFGSGTSLAGASTLPASSALPSTPGDDHVAGGLATNVWAGAALAAAADAHGHGFADFAAGAPGSSGQEVYAFAGSYGVSAYRPNVDMRRHNDSSALGILGHSETVNSFGLDHTAGQYHPSSGQHAGTLAGREAFRVVWEAKELGVAFDGSNTGQLPWSESGINGPTAPVFALVSVPLADRNYHWRTRLQLRNPYFPRTRWVSLQGTSMTESKVGTARDCDTNGTADALEISSGAQDDCNGNQVPDNCDIVQFQTSEDCNDDEVPDECEVLVSTCFDDCNDNDVPDACDIAAGTSQDCDPYGPVGPNGIPDECDIACGTLTDTNGDAVPDECQSNVTLFCFGDGGGTACPCANHSTPGLQDGCANSLGNGGRLRASGVAAIAADTFVLLGSQMPNSSALYFQGTGQSNGGLGSVFGDGLRCASGSVLRLGTKTNSANASQYPGPGDLSISVRGMVPVGGAIRHYQCWYRNAAAFCTVSTFNLTNGLSVNWVP